MDVIEGDQGYKMVYLSWIFDTGEVNAQVNFGYKVIQNFSSVCMKIQSQFIVPTRKNAVIVYTEFIC